MTTATGCFSSSALSLPSGVSADARISQPACSEADVVTFIFSCFLTKSSLKWNLVHIGYFLTEYPLKCSMVLSEYHIPFHVTKKTKKKTTSV